VIGPLPVATTCAIAWSAAIAAAIVVAPGDGRIGVGALVAASLAAGAALVTRPAAVGLLAASALLGIARAELPGPDPGEAARAAGLAGRPVIVQGTVFDDPKIPAAGYEAIVAADQPAGIGNVLVRVRGPGGVGAGDQVSASGRLKLPTDLPTFDRRAYLAQSPQFYKQMAMAAGFERVLEVGPVFRAQAEPTSRHDTEFTSVDVEMAWIDSHEALMSFEEEMLQRVIASARTKHGRTISRWFGTELRVPAAPFPRVTLAEAKEIVEASGSAPGAPEQDLECAITIAIAIEQDPGARLFGHAIDPRTA